MLPEFLNKKLVNGLQGLKKVSDYCILEENPNSIKAYLSSCSFFNATGHLLGNFTPENNRLFCGINATLYHEKDHLILCKDNYNIRIETDILNHQILDTEQFDEKITGLLCDKGVLFPAANGFALIPKNDLNIEFYSNEEMHLANMDEYCLLFDKNDHLIFSISASSVNGLYPKLYSYSDGKKHSIRLNKNCSLITFNAYAPKSIFDTTLNRSRAFRNDVYAETVYLGGANNKQWLCIRPDCSILAPIYNYDVERASIYFHRMNRIPHAHVYLGLLHHLWCAFTACWESRELPHRFLRQDAEKDNYIIVDATTFYQNLFKQRAQTSPGFVLAAKSEIPVSVATDDNYLFPVITELYLSPKNKTKQKCIKNE